MIEMWRDTVGNLTAVCSYNEEDYHYHVTVFDNNYKLHEGFLSTYYPEFGIDVSDLNMSMEIAEKLAKEIESKYDDMKENEI